MRISILFVLSLMVALSATADDHINTQTDIYNNTDSTRQDNQSVNAPTSAMSNIQINPYSNARDYFGAGVSCAQPSVNVGFAGGQSPHKTLGYVNVNFPIGGKDCKRAARTRIKTMEYALYQMQTEQGKADKLFAAKMANMCLDIQSRMTIHQDNPLYEECEQYIAIEPHPDDVASLLGRYGEYGGRLQFLETHVHAPGDTKRLMNPR